MSGLYRHLPAIGKTGGRFELVLDAHYREDKSGRVAAVAFSDWTDSEPAAEYYTEVTHAEPYKPGCFYLRELPGLLENIEKVRVLTRALLR